ncbi:MAG: endonuclease/exonuclease/phosphatase family protein [Treponema sp.]|nr:endonuclease/exonuclease/phosphatase family protein [Treponema sp.]
MKLLFGCLVLAVLLIGCSSGRKKIKLTAWNVQTFFDGIEDGTEYREFVKSKKWNELAYKARLDRLCHSMQKMDSDIFVLEEIENENVVYDIAGKLCSSWNLKKHYRYACFAKQKGSAIGCAVFSRLPLENECVHGIYSNDEGEIMPSLRPIMQVKVIGRENSFVLFVNHWKSRKGLSDGMAWRKKQEMALGCRILALNESFELENDVANVVSCGDFNQESSEFTGMADGSVEFKAFDERVYMHERKSFSGSGNSGTYYYKDRWSFIDHIFYSGNISVAGCYPETEGEWCDKETHVPLAYKVWTGTGYSDHLPVSCFIEF